MDLDKSLTYYIAGPMSNIPQFNFPQFEKAAVYLRGQGYTIVSPHEQDAPEVQKAAWASINGKLDEGGKIAGLTWGKILSKDVELVADHVDGIIFLPNWWTSRGAKLEAFVGLLTDKSFGFFYPQGSWYGNIYKEDVLVAASAFTIRAGITRWMP